MDRQLNILIFPAGSENGLDIREALSHVVNIDVFGISGKPDHAQFAYAPDHFELGDYYVNHQNFYDRLNALVYRWGIDIIIPTHDTIAYELSKNRAKIKARILVAEEKTAEICRFKSKTFQLFKDCDFCPLLYEELEDIKEAAYPVFAKPDTGQGGKGSKIVKNITEFPDLYREPYVICEYLPGQEYTVDCFTSKDGRLRFCGTRSRDRVEMGIAFRSTALKTPTEILKIAKEINSRLRFLGGWFFQVKQDKEGKFKLMEIACRHAGTMTLYRHKGINFPLLGIYELLGYETEIIENELSLIVDRCLHNSFQSNYVYNKVYIDFDDTITCKGKINIDIIAFLYQSVNLGKTIILLTRHANDINNTLLEYKISSKLFDRIIEVPTNVGKYKFVQDKMSIFIDNSFKERLEVWKKCHIPVFDVDMVDALLER